jgi:hypothetical protein
MKRKKKPPVTPVIVGLGAVAVAAIVFAQTDKGRKPVVVQPNKAKTADAGVKIVTVSERRPLSFYTGSVRTDLFNAPYVAPVEKPKPAPKPKKEPVDLSIPTTPEPVNPFSDYAYTGTVNANGKMVALIENTKTKEGQYLKEGDPFMGGTISGITDRTVDIDVAGKHESLAKTDDFKLTPLDKSAAYLTAAPAQTGVPGAPGQPGQPGQPGMPGGNPSWMQRLPADAQQRIMQRFQNMTPEQREQMQQRWMNRSFNGGGGGGRRRGGGGGGFGGGFGG